LCPYDHVADCAICGIDHNGKCVPKWRFYEDSVPVDTKVSDYVRNQEIAGATQRQEEKQDTVVTEKQEEEVMQDFLEEMDIANSKPVDATNWPVAPKGPVPLPPPAGPKTLDGPREQTNKDQVISLKVESRLGVMFKYQASGWLSKWVAPKNLVRGMATLGTALGLCLRSPKLVTGSLLALGVGEMVTTVLEKVVAPQTAVYNMAPKPGGQTTMINECFHSSLQPSVTTKNAERLIPYRDWWQGETFIREGVIYPVCSAVSRKTNTDNRSYQACSTKVLQQDSSVTQYRSVNFYTGIQESLYTHDVTINAALVGIDVVPPDRIVPVVEGNVKQTSTLNMTAEETVCCMETAKTIALLVKNNRLQIDSHSMQYLCDLKDDGGARKYWLGTVTIGLMFPPLLWMCMKTYKYSTGLRKGTSQVCTLCRLAWDLV
jgi:hypothetical protein